MSKSLFNIRQDHLTVLALIEEAEGEMTEELLQQLQLTQEDFNNKAVSYGYIIRKHEAESDTIASEIKRLQALKQRADKKADLFRKMLDEGMRQFGIEKVETDLMKISFRVSKPVELSETFQDDILKYADVSITINHDKVITAMAAGELVEYNEDLFSLLDLVVSPSKKRIGEALKEGVSVPGASFQEKKNLQIK